MAGQGDKLPTKGRTTEHTPTRQFRALLHRTKAVINEAYPVLPVRGEPPVIQVPAGSFDLHSVKQLAPLLASLSSLVCRIDVIQQGKNTHCGTGVLIGNGLVLTCRHVLPSFSVPGALRWEFRPGSHVRAWFDPDPDPRGGVSFQVVEILFAGTDSRADLDYSRDEPEIALLRLESPVQPWPAAIGRLDWATNFETLGQGRGCAVISYPGNPFRIDAAGRKRFADRLMDGTPIPPIERQFEPSGVPLYGTRCVSIGMMRLQTTPIDRYRLFASHDASTLGGSSGGCIVDLTTGRIIGVHCGGSPEKLNLMQFFCSALGRIGRREELRRAFAQAGAPGF